MMALIDWLIITGDMNLVVPLSMTISRVSKLLGCHTDSMVVWAVVCNSFTCTPLMVGAVRSLADALTVRCAQAAQRVGTTCAHKVSRVIAAKTSLLTWLCEQRQHFNKAVKAAVAVASWQRPEGLAAPILSSASLSFETFGRIRVSATLCSHAHVSFR